MYQQILDAAVIHVLFLMRLCQPWLPVSCPPQVLSQVCPGPLCSFSVLPRLPAGSVHEVPPSSPGFPPKGPAVTTAVQEPQYQEEALMRVLSSFAWLVLPVTVSSTHHRSTRRKVKSEETQAFAKAQETNHGSFSVRIQGGPCDMINTVSVLFLNRLGNNSQQLIRAAQTAVLPGCFLVYGQLGFSFKSWTFCLCVSTSVFVI